MTIECSLNQNLLKRFLFCKWPQMLAVGFNYLRLNVFSGCVIMFILPPLKIANITGLLIKYHLFPAPISREAHKSESSSNEVTMSPHCTLCEVASRMKARNAEGGSRRHHSCSGIPKYKTWLERRGGRKRGGGRKLES